MSETLAEQHAALRRMVARHVGMGEPYALLDFPDHANVGDSAIWAGEIALLSEATGQLPAHVACWHDFDAGALSRDCPAGPVFLHGGGNLGDIWPHHQGLRERVLRTLRDRRVVQLPQSIEFRDPAHVAAFADAAAGHPDFTLYVRDSHSLDWAQAHLAGGARLAPDAAIALGPQPRGAAQVPLLMLLRTDGERRGHGAPPPEGACVVDWLEDADVPGGTTPADRCAQAAARVARGLELLSQGERVVTDRLHGHLLASLLGIPHAVLDNDYGKIARYDATWAVPHGRRAATMAEAVAWATA